jgi:hypothetical protein
MSRCLRAEWVAQATVLAFYDPLNRRDHGLMIPERRGARQHTRRDHGLMVLKGAAARLANQSSTEFVELLSSYCRCRQFWLHSRTTCHASPSMEVYPRDPNGCAVPFHSSAPPSNWQGLEAAGRVNYGIRQAPLAFGVYASLLGEHERVQKCWVPQMFKYKRLFLLFSSSSHNYSPSDS